MSKANRAVPVDYDTAFRYVCCIIGDNDLSPAANDGLRRRLHDEIATSLGVSTGLVKRAAGLLSISISMRQMCSKTMTVQS